MNCVNIVLVLLGVSVSYGLVIRGGGHGHDHGVIPDGGTVIEHGLDMHHWNDKLCLEVLLVDCTSYVAQTNEQICATNGKEYQDHCHFAHARCTFLHSDNHIEVANHGACPITTAAPVTAAPPATSAPVTNAPASHTTQVAVTTTTQMVTTTTDPINNIMQNVFCQSVDTIDCQNMALEIICGTDGNIYPNNCEFSKSKCKDHSLRQQDINMCLAPPPA